MNSSAQPVIAASDAKTSAPEDEAIIGNMSMAVYLARIMVAVLMELYVHLVHPE